MSTMKQILSVIGLMAIGISGTSLFPGTLGDCTGVQCNFGTVCVPGTYQGCVEACGSIAGLTCDDPTDNCVDVPDDGCVLGVDSDCFGYCQSSATCYTLGCKDQCVDDIDGLGNAGCVSVDDQCNRPECYPPPPCANLDIKCPDGSCQGCCGCLWQSTAGGQLGCSWYRQCPAYTTSGKSSIIQMHTKYDQIEN